MCRFSPMFVNGLFVSVTGEKETAISSHEIKYFQLKAAKEVAVKKDKRRENRRIKRIRHKEAKKVKQSSDVRD